MTLTPEKHYVTREGRRAVVIRVFAQPDAAIGIIYFPDRTRQCTWDGHGRQLDSMSMPFIDPTRDDLVDEWPNEIADPESEGNRINRTVNALPTMSNSQLSNLFRSCEASSKVVHAMTMEALARLVGNLR
jgi:hypothetical protein